jgi:cell wall-associated NlpC family hydrolase
MRKKSIKGRFHCAIFFAAFALLFCSPTGYSTSSSTSAKSSAKHKKVIRSSTKTTKLNAGQKYVIQRGDSLYAIARTFNTTPEALKSANGLRSNKLKIGQKILVPVVQSASVKAKSSKINELKTAISEPSMASSATQPENPDPADQDNQSLRQRLVEAGSQMLGVRYRFGGSGKSGIDCSGLVKNLFSKFNIDLPRSSREQYRHGEIVDRNELEVGDLVFFSSGGKTPTHVGIYIGNNQFLHAARKARQVIVSDLNKFWYSMRYLGARRIMDLWWEEPSSEPEN